MKNKSIIAVFVVVTMIFTFGIAYAATDWNDDNIFNGTVNWFKNGIRIGQQGSGGVTFFNGTIVNETTTDDVDNPVAFGDNVRIDGEIWRGETSGPGDDMPVKVNDDMTIYGTLSASSIDSTSSGLAKAGANIDMDGSTPDIQSSFNNLGSAISISRTNTGEYKVGIPGVGISGIPLATVSDIATGFVKVYIGNANEVLVATYDTSGAAKDLGFKLVVFQTFQFTVST